MRKIFAIGIVALLVYSVGLAIAQDQDKIASTTITSRLPCA